MSLTLELIDDEHVWEPFVAKHSPEALFQSWYWTDVLAKVGTPVARLGFFEKDRLVGVAAASTVRAKRGRFLHVRHGPILADTTHTMWRHAVSMLADFARRQHALFLRISPLLSNTSETRALLGASGFRPSPIHEVDAERCWVLDLDRPLTELMAGMRKTTRYEVRLAQKLGCTVSISDNPKDLKHFFKLYEETSRRHGFVVHESIAEEFAVFSQAQKALLFLGRHQQKVLASAIVLFYGHQAIYHHGASTVSRVPVSYLVQWEAIMEAKKRGMNVYNFYGIAPEDKPNHPWRGITLFKKGFGGREITFIHSQDLPLSPLYLVPYTVEKVRTKLRGY